MPFSFGGLPACKDNHNNAQPHRTLVEAGFEVFEALFLETKSKQARLTLLAPNHEFQDSVPDKMAWRIKQHKGVRWAKVRC